MCSSPLLGPCTLYSVLCTYIQSTLRTSLDPTLKNAPRRAGLFLLCASQLECPSRVGFVPFFHRYVSHTCSQASWSKSRRDRCAGMLQRMRACVRLASRTRFGVAHAHRDMHQRALEMKKVAGLEIARPLFSSATTSASTSLNLAHVGVVLLAPPAFPNDMPVTGHAPPNPKEKKKRHHRHTTGTLQAET